MADIDRQVAVERRTPLLQAANERGLLGPKDRRVGGRFSDALVERAKRVSGIAENTDLLTHALIKVALEDDFGDRLLRPTGRVPKGTLFSG